MRRTILLSLFALLLVSLATDARAQRRGGAGFGNARGGYGFGHAHAVSPRRFGYANLPYGAGYAYLPYDSGYEDRYYDSGAAYPYPPQSAVFFQQPPMFVQPPAPPVVQPSGHPVITEYNWPAADTASSASDSEPQAFGIVLKNGSTLSAVAVYASDDGLHYVDPDERHLRISMSQVDRTATLKLNRGRNLNLYLPASQ
jgi:hypothetical protein